MRTTITLIFFILNFFNIFVNGFNIEDEIVKDEKNQVQVSNYRLWLLVWLRFKLGVRMLLKIIYQCSRNQICIGASSSSPFD